MKLNIKDTKVELKYTLRALFLFEKIKGCAFSLNTLLDEYLFFYCLILANNKEIDMTFDDFIDVLDADITLMSKYKEFLQKEMERQNVYDSEEHVDNKKKL